MSTPADSQAAQSLDMVHAIRTASLYGFAYSHAIAIVIAPSPSPSRHRYRHRAIAIVIAVAIAITIALHCFAFLRNGCVPSNCFKVPLREGP